MEIKIQSMKNLIDLIGNRTRGLPACIAMPQPTAPLEMVFKSIYTKIILVAGSSGLHVTVALKFFF